MREVVLRFHQALFGGQAVPVDGFGEVLQDALSMLVGDRQRKLGFGVTALGGTDRVFDGARRVGLAAQPQFVILGQPECRRSQAPVGGAPIPLPGHGQVGLAVDALLVEHGHVVLNVDVAPVGERQPFVARGFKIAAAHGAPPGGEIRVRGRCHACDHDRQQQRPAQPAGASLNCPRHTHLPHTAMPPLFSADDSARFGGEKHFLNRPGRPRACVGEVRVRQEGMKLRLFQIDAFTSRVFSGNPAAVCPLESWLDDAVLQAIAAENNLSETAFFVPEGDGFALRWFTPALEVDLCGHATLASGHAVLTILDPTRESVAFSSRSGPLTVSRAGDSLAMDFPALPPEPCAPPADLVAGLGAQPDAVLVEMDYLAVFAAEADVAALSPDMAAIARLDRRGVIATAPGESVDFVSRFFAPRAGIPEDPVTGSAHCLLTPYWAERLGKERLEARQISARGGALTCELQGARVRIEGRVALYLDGEITL